MTSGDPGRHQAPDLDAAVASATVDPGNLGGFPRRAWQVLGATASPLVGVATRCARDPRTAGVLGAGPRVATFLARSHRRSAGAGTDDSVVPVRPTPLLALQALVDEVLIALFHHPDLVPGPGDFAPAAADLRHTRDLFFAKGWLERPERYHRDPPVPDDVAVTRERTLDLTYDHLTFASGWEPDPAEVGRERWLAHEANRAVHAWVSSPPEDGGSWLVCVHGFGMGSSGFMDLRAFRAPQLRRQGIGVVVPVLPLHGPRASGRVRGEDLMTIDLVDSMHGVAQAVWDVRRVVAWLRATRGATRVGLLGYSFGGLVASLVASLEDDLAFVVAGIPVVDLPELFRRHSRPHTARLAEASGVLGPVADDVHRVVSPLAMTCRVPRGHRYIFAGLADRMSTFGQARRLWLHWDRPELVAYAGGHVGFFWSKDARRMVDEAVTRWLVPSR
ncbi:MAG TPA: alpha/beta fold hydrolase [Acidimicrobiales bacterium]|nr:alpha/beta fold hydrolase [Acidimicrobiales bacterium]